MSVRRVDASTVGHNPPTTTPMSIRSYKDLKVWNAALKLVGTVYKITEHFPREERLVSPAN